MKTLLQTLILFFTVIQISEAQTWDLGGNSSTGGAAIGTTTNEPFPFIVNGTEKMRLSEYGNLGLGDNNPLPRLSITPGNSLTDPYEYMNDCHPTYAPLSSYGIIVHQIGGETFNRAIHGFAAGPDKSNIGGTFLATGTKSPMNSECAYNMGLHGEARGDNMKNDDFNGNLGTIGVAAGHNSDNTAVMGIGEGDGSINQGGLFMAFSDSCHSENIGVIAMANGGKVTVGLYATATDENSTNCSMDTLEDRYSAFLAAYFEGNTLTSGNAYVLSDKKFKRDIQLIEKPSELLSKINVYSYGYVNNGRVSTPNKTQFGVLAQEVKEVAPHLVKGFKTPNINIQTQGIKKGGEELLAVNYTEFIPLLIGAHNEQKQNTEELEATVAQQSEEIEELKNELKEIKDLLKNLCSQGCDALKSLSPSEKIEIKGFPNPANRVLNIQLDQLSNQQIYTVQLIDVNGAVHFSQKVQNLANYQISVPTEKLISGNYKIVVYHSNGSTTTSNVVIQK